MGLDHRLVQLLVILASSGLPALILSGQDGLTTHSVAAVGEGMVEADIWDHYIRWGANSLSLPLVVFLAVPCSTNASPPVVPRRSVR